jgi:hypothetical protein
MASYIQPPRGRSRRAQQSAIPVVRRDIQPYSLGRAAGHLVKPLRNEGQCSLSARLRMTSAARIASLRRKHHEQRKAAHHGEHGTVEKDGSMADMIP